MLDLAALQNEFAQGVLGEAPGTALQEEVIGDGLEPEARLQIYRNTYRESLSDALLSIYPVTEAFVGKLFLKEALRRFVIQEPPLEPALFNYGSGFSRFLVTYPASEPVPYIADIAALEWQTHNLMGSAEVTVNGEEDAIVAVLQAGRRPINPNARLLKSSYPVYDLWRAGTGQIQPEDLDVAAGGQAVLILLYEGEIFYQVLPTELVSFLESGESNGRPEPEIIREAIERGALAIGGHGEGVGS